MDTKGKITKTTPPSQWFKNVAKSLGYSSANVIKDITPSISSMVSSNATYTKELADKLRSSGTGNGFSISDYVNVGTYVDIAKSAVSNAYSDILSGNIYNRDRQASAYEDDMDEFDLDSFGDIGDSSSSSESSSEESTDSEGGKKVVNNTTNVVNVNKDVGVLADTVQSTIDQVSANTQASTDALISANTKLMSSKSVVDHSIGTQQIDAIKSVNENLGLLINFQNDSMAKYIGASIQYYDESLEVLKGQFELVKMNSPVKKPDTTRHHAYDDVFQNDVINFEGYVGNVKKNFNKLKEENFLVNSLFTVGSNTEQLQYMANAPLKFLADMATKHLIPMTIRATMERLDKSVTEFIPALFNKFSRMGYSNNPILEVIGKLFGIDTRMKLSPRMNGYERGTIPFDGETKRAITDIIPTYLRKMLAAMTGSKEIAFDWEQGRWSNVEEMRRAYETAKMQKVTSGYSDAYNEATSYMNGIRFINQDEKARFQKGIEELFFNLTKSESIVKFDDSAESRRAVRELSGLEGNMSVLLSAIMSNMDNAKKMSTANNYKALSNMEQFFTQIEKNPTLFNANTILTGLVNDEFLKTNADGKIIGSKATKGGGIIGARSVDGYGKDQLYYLREIVKNLVTGIKTFVLNGSSIGSTTVIETDEEEGSLSIPEDIARNAESFGRVKTVREDDVVALKPLDDLTAAGKEKQQKEVKEQNIIDLASSDVNPDTFNADVLARKQYMREQPKKKDSFGDYFGRSLGDGQQKFNKVKVALDEIVRKPSDVLKIAFDKIDSVMYNIIFGRNNDPTSSFMSGILDRMTDMFEKVADFAIERVFVPAGEFITGVFSKTANAAKDNIIVSSIKDGIKYWFVGNKEDGKRQGGVFSSIMNDTKDLMLSFNHSVTGIGYTDTNGVKHETNKESLFHSMKDIVKDIGSTTKKHFFGDKSSGNTDDHRGMLGTVTDMLGDGIQEWNRVIFGKTPDEKAGREVLKENATAFIKNAPRGILGYIGGAAAGGVIYGGGLGLLGSFLLPGGPMGMALVGGALGLATGSETFKNWAFGEIGGDGKRIGGQLISANTKEFLSRNKTKLIGGAIGGLALNALSSTVLNSFSPELGAIASFLSPFGPIGAAFQGMATAMILKSETVLSWMFGAKNADGVRIGGMLQRVFRKPNMGISKMNAASKIGFNLVGMGAGALGGSTLAATLSSFGAVGALLATPLGPVTGAIAGLAAAIALSSDGVKNFLFGSQENKDGEGMIERAFGSFKHYITDPLIQSFKNTGKHFANWITNFHLPNLQFVTEPLIKMAKDITTDVLKVTKATLWDIPWTVGSAIAGTVKTAVSETYGFIKSKIQESEIYNTVTEKITKPLVDTMHRAIGLPFRALTSGIFKATTMIARGLGDLSTTLMIVPGAVASSFDFARESVVSLFKGTSNLFKGTIDIFRNGQTTDLSGNMIGGLNQGVMSSIGALMADSFSLKRIGNDVDSTAGDRLRGSYAQLLTRHQAYKDRRQEIKDEHKQWKEDWGKNKNADGGTKFYGYGANRRMREEYTFKYIKEFEKKTGVGVNEALNIDPKIKIKELKKNQYDYLQALVKDSIRSGKKGDDFRKHRGIDAYQRSQEEAIRSIDSEIAKSNDILGDIRSLVTTITEVTSNDAIIKMPSQFMDANGTIYNGGDTVNNVSEILNFTSGTTTTNSEVISTVLEGSKGQGNTKAPTIKMQSVYGDGKKDYGKAKEQEEGEIKFTSSSNEGYNAAIEDMVRTVTYADDKERLKRQQKEEDEDESVGGGIMDSVSSYAKGKAKSLYNNSVPTFMRRYSAQQIEEIGCGPIVLATVLAQYGVRTTAEKLFTLALDEGLVEEGIGVSSKIFQLAAKKYSLSYNAYKGNAQGLKRAFELSDNVIVRITTASGHYILLRGYSKSKGTVMVTDPMGKFSGEIELAKLTPYITHVYIVYKKGIIAKAVTKLTNQIEKKFKSKSPIFTTVPEETGGSIKGGVSTLTPVSPEERGMLPVNKSVMHIPSRLNVSDLGVMPVTIIKTKDELKLEEERFDALLASNDIISDDSGSSGSSGESNSSDPNSLDQNNMGLNRVNTWMSIAKALVKGIYGMGKGIFKGLFGMGKAAFNLGGKTRRVMQGQDTFNMPNGSSIGTGARAIGGAIGGVVKAGFRGVRRVVNNFGGISGIAAKTANVLSQAGDVGSYANLSAIPNGYSTASAAEENFRFVNDGTSMGDQKKAFNKRNNVNAFLQRKAEEAAAAADAAFKGSMVDLSTRIEINTRMTAQLMGDMLDLTKGFTDWLKPFLENKMDECCGGGGGGGGITDLLDDLLRLLPLLFPSWLRKLFGKKDKPIKPDPNKPDKTKPTNDPGKPTRTPTVIPQPEKKPKPVRTPLGLPTPTVDLTKQKKQDPVKTKPTRVDLTKKPAPSVPTIRTPKPTTMPVPTVDLRKKGKELPPTTRPVKDAMTGEIKEMPIRHDVIDIDAEEVKDKGKVGHDKKQALPEPKPTVKEPEKVETVRQPKKVSRLPIPVNPEVEKYLEQQRKMSEQLDTLDERSRKMYKDQTGKEVKVPDIKPIESSEKETTGRSTKDTKVEAEVKEPVKVGAATADDKPTPPKDPIKQKPVEEKPKPVEPIKEKPVPEPEAPKKPKTIAGGDVSRPATPVNPQVAEYVRQQQELANGFDDLDSRARRSSGQDVEPIKTKPQTQPRSIVIDRANAIEAEIISDTTPKQKPTQSQDSRGRRDTSSTPRPTGNSQIDGYLDQQRQLADGFDDLNDRARGNQEETTKGGKKGGKRGGRSGGRHGKKGGLWQGVKNILTGGTGLGIIAGSNTGEYMDGYSQDELRRQNANAQMNDYVQQQADLAEGFQSLNDRVGDRANEASGGAGSSDRETRSSRRRGRRGGGSSARRGGFKNTAKTILKSGGSSLAKLGGLATGGAVTAGLAGLDYYYGSTNAERIFNMEDPDAVATDTQKKAAGIATAAVGLIPFADLVDEMALEGKMKQTVAEFTEGILSMSGNINEIFTKGWDMAVQGVTVAAGAIGEYAGKAWDKAKDYVGERWDSAVEGVKLAASKVSEYTSEKWDEIKTSVSDSWNLMKDTVVTGFTNAIDNTKAKWEEMKTNVSESWTTFKTTISDGFTNAIDNTKAKWEEMKTNVSEGWTNIKTSVIEKGQAMLEDAKTKWNELKTSIATKWKEKKDAIVTKVQAMITDAKEKWENLKKEVSSGWTKAKTAVVGKVTGMITNATEKWDSIKSTVSEKWDSIKSTITGAAESMVKTVVEKWDGIKTSIGTTWDTIKTTITSSIETAISSIGSFSLTDALSGFGSTVKTRLVDAAKNFSFASLFGNGGKGEGIGTGPTEEEGKELNKAVSKVEKALDAGKEIKMDEIAKVGTKLTKEEEAKKKSMEAIKGIGGPTDKDGQEVTKMVEEIDFKSYGDEPSFAKGCLPCEAKEKLETAIYGNGPSDDYYQTDARWSGAKVAGKAKIKDSGCGPTVAANLVKSMTGNNVTPVDAVKHAQAKGFADEKLGVSSELFGSFGKEYGLQTQPTSINQDNLEKVLGAGNKVVLRGEKGANYTDEGHFVIADGVTKDGKVKIKDPMGKARSGEYSFAQVSKGLTNAFAVRGNGDGIKQTFENPEAIYAMGGDSGFSNPMPKGRLTSKYGYRTDPNNGDWRMHWGVDLANGGGTPIQAAADGVVTVATYHKSYGNYVIIKHVINGQRWDTVYAHMSSLKVKAGEQVKRGQILGYEGQTGKSKGNHLHFEIHKGPYAYGKNNVDPEPLIFKNGSKTPSSFLGTGVMAGVAGLAGSAINSLTGGDFDDVTNRFNFDIIPEAIKRLPNLIDKITDMAFFGVSSAGVDEIFEGIGGSAVGEAGEATSTSFNPTGKKKTFIDKVKPGAIKSWKEYKVMPSLVLAQAAEESGWGKHAIGNNLFGIKAGSSWKGKTQEVWTTEEDKNGRKYQIKAKFRDYASIDDSIMDHAKLLTAARYAKVLQARNYREATRAVREAGYATNSDYTNNLNAIIEGNGFMQVDKEAGAPTEGIKGLGTGGPSSEQEVFDVYKAMEGTKLNAYKDEVTQPKGIGGPDMADIPNVYEDLASAQESLASLGNLDKVSDVDVVSSYGRGDIDVYQGNYEMERFNDEQNRVYNNHTTNITSMIPEGGAWTADNVNRALSALETIAANSLNRTAPVLNNTNVELSTSNSGSQKQAPLPPMGRRNNGASQRRNAIISKGRK